MPTYSEITITFDRDIEIGAKLRILTAQQNGLIYLGDFTWVANRVFAKTVTAGTPTANVGETSAINFKDAFDLDYPTGYVTSIVDTNKVLIQSETLQEDLLNVIIDYADGTSNQPPVEIDNYLENAYQHKIIYYISYCDDFNTTRNVFILKKGYTGGATELLADVNPISISYESSDDFKFSPIRPSQAEVFMIFGGNDVDFEEFWTADEKEFKVQDVKDGTIEWSGYVIPSGFQYEFKGGLYYASIQASDGLGTLESLTFVDDNQKPYGNQDLVYNDGFVFPFSLIITEILKKLELDLDLWTCIDSYERTMTKTGDVREADPLSASFVNVKTYIKLIEDKKIPYWYGSGEEWNCHEVLENILYMFGAKIYQEFGVWRIKSINTDVDYGTGATQRYWRKYNTVGTYLGNYELVNDEINIPCNDSTKYLVGNDHVMSMDDVYKAFRMNYEYTFLRYGDTPVNLLQNGSFNEFDDSSVYSAPLGWARVRKSSSYPYMRYKSIDISVDGNTKGIEVGTQATGTPTTGTTDRHSSVSGLVSLPTKDITKGDALYFDIWNNFIYKPDPSQTQYRNTVMYRMVLISDVDSQTGEITKYYLRNGDVSNEFNEVIDGYVWERSGSKNGDAFEDTTCFYLPAEKASNYDSSEDYTNTFWFNFKNELPEAPITGNLYFIIHGLASNKDEGASSDFYIYKYPSYTFVHSSGDYERTGYWRVLYLNPMPLQITGALVGVIRKEDELPQQHDYIYNNTNKNYSLQVDPITIYNGDVQDENHISNIIVPTNTDGSKNFWDDLSGTYGSSSLGLLTVREIMRQYQKPYRILEGTLKIQDARFGSVYTFDTIPNVRFILQRGSINKQKQYIEDATFVQISSDVLPNGGFEGGNSLEPEWVYTGNSYCEIGEDKLNTGYVINEEADVNPSSETYQDTREVTSTSQDLTQCPLSTPRLYYWGSDDVFLDASELTFSPFSEVSSNEIQVDLDNVEGNYLYFVHLKSIGVVEKITTPTSPNNVLSDWVYLADETIDGYIYRVLRTDYVMTEFNGFTHNFKFN